MAKQQKEYQQLLKMADQAVTTLSTGLTMACTAIGRMIHCLMTGSDFDIARAVTGNNELQSNSHSKMAAHFESNDLAKKQKLFQKMDEKLKVAFKTEYPMLQEAYNRVAQCLKDKGATENLDEFLALSRSNQNQPNINNSLLSNQDSHGSRLIESDVQEIEKDFELFDLYAPNEGLTASSRKESIADALNNLTQRVSDTPFDLLSKITLETYLVGLKSLMGRLIRQDQRAFGGPVRHPGTRPELPGLPSQDQAGLQEPQRLEL